MGMALFWVLVLRLGVLKFVRMLSLGSITIVQDFLPIALGTTDVILGVKWLETLGDVTSNH